jgi:dihydroorotate dehydrogenase electron transfer subunit
MQMVTGRVSEIQTNSRGEDSAWIDCPPSAIPAPGQYTLAYDAHDPQAVLGTALFPAGYSDQGFFAAPPLPAAWNPGTRLELRGPLGHGFQLPAKLRRLACAPLDQEAGRLLPLIQTALSSGSDVVMFADMPLPRLPSALEVQPLAALSESLAWPELLALDLPASLVSHLRSFLGWDRSAFLPCPVQALIVGSMPCFGLAECGACAVPTRRSWKLACKEGPVFDLRELKW